MNILIVDDKEENIIALEALIRRDDINIISTVSPNEALKLAWEQPIALALIDVQMPGIDGFELAEMLKSNPRTRDILIIFVTAISKESKYAVKGLSTGAVDYLYKPLDPTITVAKVDSFIQLAKAQDEVKHKNLLLEKYSVILSNSADMICLVDIDTMVIGEVNPSVEKILGYSQEQFVEKSVYSFIVEEQHELFNENLNKLQQNYDSVTFELQLKDNKGELVWTECRVTCNKKSYFFNISDHRLQREYEQQLIISKEEAIQARNVKERFLANMSHELRTPLNGIIGVSNLLKQTDLGDHQKQMVNLLEVSSQSLLGVVNDILDITKIDSGKFVLVKKEVNIRHLLRSVIELLRVKANEKLLKLELNVDDSIPRYLETDPLRLNQILMNLLGNAIKFTGEGYVQLNVSQVAETGKEVTLRFSVVDTGIGIQPERKNRIFNSYEQGEDDTSLKYGGTGLGLGIVRKLVELQNGEIDFTSEYGKGTTFWFTITFKSLESDRNYTTKTGGDMEVDLKPFTDLRALVAEDNVINQFLVSKVLKGWNIETDVVEDGLLALEKLQENHYDFILMDTYMPGLGGYDTTKKIRSEFDGDKKNIKIISMSAAVLEEEQKAALSAGMNYVLTKPFIPQDLHRIITEIVGKA